MIPHIPSRAASQAAKLFAYPANEASSDRIPRVWTITVPAPFVKPVVKRKTGKVFPAPTVPEQQ